MADLSGFDANNVEPTTDFDPIPAGKYLAVIVESEMKVNKAGTGEYLELTFEVIEGDFTGRKLWARLNLDNPNAKAVQIAKAELSAVCRAVGVLAPNDSSELHDIPLVIHVKCRKRADTGEIANEVKGYSAKSAAEPAAPKPTPAAASAKPVIPPWKR